VTSGSQLAQDLLRSFWLSPRSFCGANGCEGRIALSGGYGPLFPAILRVAQGYVDIRVTEQNLQLINAPAILKEANRKGIAEPVDVSVLDACPFSEPPDSLIDPGHPEAEQWSVGSPGRVRLEQILSYGVKPDIALLVPFPGHQDGTIPDICGLQVDQFTSPDAGIQENSNHRHIAHRQIRPLARCLQKALDLVVAVWPDDLRANPRFDDADHRVVPN
jgi:hypothetical protein